jgi:serine/threonine protein kinase
MLATELRTFCLQMEMAHQVADALCRLHAMGILHKDVSPGNIMQAATGVWHLADFGISAMCTSTLGITNTSMACNLDYAAPEQVIPDARVTDRSDVWSLAAAMLHALTGGRPYGNVPSPRIMGLLFQGRGPAIPAADLPSNVVELLTACLQSDPTQRPTAMQLEQMLAAVREGDGDQGEALVAELQPGCSTQRVPPSVVAAATVAAPQAEVSAAEVSPSLWAPLCVCLYLSGDAYRD